jgi:hypothetical protein
MSRVTVAVVLLFLLFQAAPVSSSNAPRPDGTGHVVFIPSIPKDTLPPWRYDDMTRVVAEQSGVWSPHEVRDLELLAWYAVVDDRPLYVNAALFGVRLTGGRWGLAQLGQNPIPDPHVPPERASARMNWFFWRITDVDWEPAAVFAHKPSPEDIDRFLRFWHEQTYWRTLSQGFRAQTWQAFLGVPAPASLRALNEDRGN